MSNHGTNQDAAERLANHNHRVRTATVAFFAFVAYMGSASPAFPAPTQENSSPAISSYAVPIAALDGMTLAQYVHEHQARDPRTTTVI